MPAPKAQQRRITGLPRPAHVVVVVEENHTLAQVVMQPNAAAFLQGVARDGALFTDAHGVTHPSLPNYFAMFAGITNTNGDDCPAEGIDPGAPNLASELIAAHFTFAGYSEGLPAPGSTVCWAGPYARKHNPWVFFTNVPANDNLPLTSFPKYENLPTVSFIVPNVQNDMHDIEDGTVQTADAWAKQHVGPLIAWAKTHDTLVIFTWDEGYDSDNSIPMIFTGPMVKAGRYSRNVNHYTFLRTLEAMYGLPYTGNARHAHTIANIWK